jgi:hypothetical protein
MLLELMYLIVAANAVITIPKNSPYLTLFSRFSRITDAATIFIT